MLRSSSVTKVRWPIMSKTSVKSQLPHVHSQRHLWRVPGLALELPWQRRRSFLPKSPFLGFSSAFPPRIVARAGESTAKVRKRILSDRIESGRGREGAWKSVRGRGLSSCWFRSRLSYLPAPSLGILVGRFLLLLDFLLRPPHPLLKSRLCYSS